MLVGHNLSKIHPDGTGIRSLSISIEHGEGRVIMGPSGCGKTTLLRILSLLDVPQTGTVEMDGEKYEFPRNSGRQPVFPYPQVTMVFQQLFLWPHLKNRVNLNLSLQGQSQKDRLNELIERLDIKPFLDKYPNQSSLGQRQRVAIARSLALLPKYVLLDEATSALDSKLTKCMSEILLEARATGLGFVVVTHDHRFARLLDSKVLYMENGTFIEPNNALGAV